MYVCICMYMYACICRYVYVCMCVYVCVYVCMYVCRIYRWEMSEGGKCPTQNGRVNCPGNCSGGRIFREICPGMVLHSRGLDSTALLQRLFCQGSMNLSPFYKSIYILPLLSYEGRCKSSNCILMWKPPSSGAFFSSVRLALPPLL